MASKSNKSVEKEKITITEHFPKFAGYVDYALNTPISVQIKNPMPEATEVKVCVFDSEKLLIPYETKIQIPFESSVEVNLEGIFSPLYLAGIPERKTVEAEVNVFSLEGALLARQTGSIEALPYDVWEGLEGNPERLAGYIRPRIADCSRILEDAGARLKKWSSSIEFYGYTGADKNAVRQILASVFAAIKNLGIQKAECDLSEPVSAFRDNLIATRRASSLELALFAASCLEAARLHPVVALGKDAVGVGAWLYDSCFLETVTDDWDIVGKYISDGINNLAFFDVEDLFSRKNGAYSLSESHFAQKLKEGFYESFVDVRRCRMAGIGALPLRGKSLHGFELIKESQMSDEEAPAPLKELRKLALGETPQKNNQWERRLLDLTFKNALLNFTGKNALHLHCTDGDMLFGKIFETGGMRLKEGGAEPLPFGVQLSPSARDLNVLELKKGILRAYGNTEELQETARLLLRKNKEADEETGAKILYLAFGFLKYIGKEDQKPKRAPLVLLPVSIKRAKGNEDYEIEGQEKEFSVNSTLLEFLKQEFNIDVRGLASGVSSLKISEIMAMVLAETANMKDWTVENDIYLATFSFQRYLMWNDIHSHFDKLKENAIVSALFEGKTARSEQVQVPEEDEGDPRETLLALPADSSQYSAIALSRTGKSFVLHGPPGTGKSQTITNIIANALEDHKRVLFVAEKKAALDVVKKRLDSIGIGEFCLELHSNKTDKADVLSRMEKTLSLAKTAPEEAFDAKAGEIVNLRQELLKPMLALHKKYRLGISIYQAILLYLKNKDAPDVLDIESAFYDSLDEKKLSECKSRILSAAAAAKECGGVHCTPFENVYVSEYSTALRDRVFCSAEVVIAEIKHLKAFLALFLEFYRQKMSAITQKKLENLCQIAQKLGNGTFDKYFSSGNEEQFYVFYNANRRLDECLSYYLRHFKSLIPLSDKEVQLIKGILETGDGCRKNKQAYAIFKRLSRVALHSVGEEDAPKYFQTVVEIYEAMERIRSAPLSKNFLDRSGDIVFKRRTEFLRDLYELHDLCAKTFLDYNADAFNGMCLRAQNGYTRPVLEGYLKAAEAFFNAQEQFLQITQGKKSKIQQEDVLEYYSVKAGALLDNVDMLPNWCMYRQTAIKLKELGCSFVTEALESGKLTGENVLSGFEKNVYQNFLEINIPADPDLSRLTVGTLEETVEKFRATWEEFALLTRKKLRYDLTSQLPAEDGSDSASLEVGVFRRLSKNNLRGLGLRALFAEIPMLLRKVCPCMLMSPTTVAQYIQPEANLFDLVIFDEASQMTTAEAIGSLARAKAAVIVGDPHQLPPTSFFHSMYVDEENPGNEDLESILDDCLALGMTERHLKWHYRSKHESLIAFSNSMYYDNRLCTFPSPDAMDSKVKFVHVDGTYDRGFTKRNRKETEALVKEVIRRLQDPVLNQSSMGVVTFSSAQQGDIEKLLFKEIAQKKLEAVAYEREEPIFVKNLENVQGDERDVILFSVCYGPDATGRVSLNFGPLNQTGGWRRLNVALSRAREEMIVFSSMTYGMIDLSKTTSKGVAGLKKFLEFAEKGRTTLSVRSALAAEEEGIGKYLAKELENYGYDCRTNVGASDFKIDVAVVDPGCSGNFLLAIICDGTERFSVKDRNILQIQTLKRANWNVMRVNCVNFYNNPKREVKRIKEVLDKLTGAERKGVNYIAKYSKAYKAVKSEGAEVAAFVTSGDNDAKILSRLREIVAVEEPISRQFLKTRCLTTFGIQKSGSKIDAKLDALIDACAFHRERVIGRDYFMKKDSAALIGKFRIEKESALRKSEKDLTPFEVVSLTKALLEERVSVYLDELTSLVAGVFRLRQTEQLAVFVRECISYGEERGIFVRSVSDRISLA